MSPATLDPTQPPRLRCRYIFISTSLHADRTAGLYLDHVHSRGLVIAGACSPQNKSAKFGRAPHSVRAALLSGNYYGPISRKNALKEAVLLVYGFCEPKVVHTAGWERASARCNRKLEPGLQETTTLV